MGVALDQAYRIVMTMQLGRKGFAALSGAGWYSSWAEVLRSLGWPLHCCGFGRTGPNSTGLHI
jgi:hypothetical protein